MPALNTLFAQGTHAGRPAAATTNAGFYYFETDTGYLFQSTGASWSQVAGVAGNQSANTVFAGPTSGGAATAAFRTLVAADVPAVNGTNFTSGSLATALLGNVGMLINRNPNWQPGASGLTKAFMAATGGTVYTDITTAINGLVGATLNYGAMNDAVYIGSTSANSGQFWRWDMNLATPATWSLTLTYEYFSSAGGGTWTAFPAGTNFTDGMVGFTSSLPVAFLPPADWVTTTVNGVAGWWIRDRCTAFTSSSVSPVLKQATMQRWSNATQTQVNGLIPSNGTITTCTPKFGSTNALGFYNFTSNTYTVIGTNPVPATISGLSIPVSAGDAYCLLSIASPANGAQGDDSPLRLVLA